MNEQGTPEAQHWFIGEAVANPFPQRHDMAMVRALSDAEVEDIRRADGLIARIGGDMAYQRCVTLLDVARQRVAAAAESTGGRELAATRDAANALMASLDEFAVAVVETAQEFGAENETQERVAERAERARENSAWTNLRALAEGESESVRRVDPGIVVFNHDGSDIAIELLLIAAVSQAQQLQFELIAALTPAIIGAAKLLRQLTVEVPSGQPMLIHIPLVSADRAKMTPQPLRIDLITPSVRATQLVPHLIASASAGNDPAETGATPDSPSEPDADESDEPFALDDETSTDAGLEDIPAGGADPRASTGAGPSPSPVDYSELRRLCGVLCPALAEEWSRALDPERLPLALAEQLAPLDALLLEHQRRVEAESKALQSAGINPYIPVWPPSIEQVSALPIDPASAEDRELRSRSASLLGFAQLAQATAALRQATTTKFSFALGQQPKLEQFWHSGAFRNISDCLYLFDRLTADYQSALAELTEAESAPHPDERSEFPVRSRLAQSALSTGDLEAAVVHVARAAASLLGSPVTQAVLETAFESHPELPVEGVQLLVNVTELARRIGAGESTDLATCALVAPLAHQLVVALALPPGLAEAMRDDPAEAPADTDSRSETEAGDCDGD